MTTATTIKPVCFSNRAPKGGAVSPVNGRYYLGGRFMPMVAVVVELKPAPLEGSTRQVAWGSRLRREALACLDDEIHARLLFLASPIRTQAAQYRPIVRKLLVARHALMAETSAASIIDRRATPAW